MYTAHLLRRYGQIISNFLKNKNFMGVLILQGGVPDFGLELDFGNYWSMFVWNTVHRGRPCQRQKRGVRGRWVGTILNSRNA